MKDTQRKIALIELFPYHTECLYSQLLFLQDYKHVTLICDRKVEKIVANFVDKCEEIIYYDFSKISSLFKLHYYLFKHHFDTVILNTAQGSRPLKFAVLPHKQKLKIVGTVHDTSKITTSLGQRIICRRMAGFYVLAKYIDGQIDTEWGYQHCYFSPIYYPQFERTKIEKNNEIWVCIPGAIEYKRRDYKSLIDIAKNEDLDKRVKFVLLGNQKLGEGDHFIEQIQREGLQSRFITFPERVPDPTFYAYVDQSDFLLTLIHPSVESFDDYMTSKISGMFPLAMAFNKPLLCHKAFAAIKDFDFKALFYHSTDELVTILNSKTNNSGNYAPNFEKNQQRYLQLL